MPWRSRFAKRSSTRPGLLVGAVALGAVVSVIGLAIGSSPLAFVGLAAAIVGAGGFALHLIVTERRRHEYAEGELESLVESLGRIAESLDPDQVLERTLREAKDLFGAKASLLSREDTPRTDTAALVPLHIRHERIGALQLVRAKPLDREEIARRSSATATRSARYVTSRSTSSRWCCATRASRPRCAHLRTRSGSRTGSRSTSTSRRARRWRRTRASASTRSSASRLTRR